MSKFPEYKHEKSQEWFNRALDAIPSGVYGHLGPSEGLFLPITKWPLMSDHAKGTYFGTLTEINILTLCVLTVLMFWAIATMMLIKQLWNSLKGVTALLLLHIKW